MKTPPYSIESERNVLGAILSDNKYYDDVSFLMADDFFSAEHRNIFTVLKENIENGHNVDYFLAHEKSADIELSYLVGVVKECYAPINAKLYADVVKSKSISRKLLTLGSEISQSVYADESDQLDKAQEAISKISESHKNKSEPQVIAKFLKSTLDGIERAYNNKGDIIGLSTGLVDLDSKTLGMHPSDLIIIAGRPAMGKTSLALNIAEAVAKTGEPTLVFSMEMSAEQLTQRELSSLSGISLNAIRSGDLDDSAWSRLAVAVKKLNEMPLIIDEAPALTIGEVRLRARKIKRERGLSLIIIDYIQLMQGRGYNRNESISEISRGLKAIAKELRIPVIALSQLNRELEKRPNKRPQASDLRDSGAIEQDADVILFVYRDEMYNEGSPYEGIAEIIINKQRQGETGKIYASFKGELCRFDNFAGNLPEYQKPTKGFRG